MKLIKQFDEHTIPGGTVFGHRTHLLDAWTRMPEIITLPDIKVIGGAFEIELTDGDTNSLGYTNSTNNPIRLIKQRTNTQVPERYIYDARYEVDTNVGHYLIDTVTKILLAYQMLEINGKDRDKLVVIIRSKPDRIARELFSTLGIPVIETDSNIIGNIFRTRVIPGTSTIRGGISYSDVSTIGIVKNTYMANLKYRPVLKSPLGEKIFISRKNTRRIENEDEVEDVLKRHGYEKVYFEDGQFSLDEQWSIVSSAKNIFAIHGAGLTAILFNGLRMAENSGTNMHKTKIVELFGPGYFVGFFRSLAAALDLEWHGIRGKLTQEFVRDMEMMGGGRIHHNSNFTVDTFSVEQMLAKIEG